jgi:hypothetical protein
MSADDVNLTAEQPHHDPSSESSGVDADTDSGIDSHDEGDGVDIDIDDETWKTYARELRRDYPGLYEVSEKHFNIIIKRRVRRDQDLDEIGGEQSVRDAAAERKDGAGGVIQKYVNVFRGATAAREQHARDVTRDGAPQ